MLSYEDFQNKTLGVGKCRMLTVSCEFITVQNGSSNYICCIMSDCTNNLWDFFIEIKKHSIRVRNHFQIDAHISVFTSKGFAFDLGECGSSVLQNQIVNLSLLFCGAGRKIACWY